MEFHKINKNLHHNTKALKKWNIEVFGLIHIKIKTMEEELEILKSNNLDGPRQTVLKEKLKCQRRIQESIYRQKSCEVWLKDVIEIQNSSI